MIRKSHAALLALLLLTACEKDPTTACFDNGEHEKMSDGRITRICDCALSKIRADKMTPAQQKALVAIIEGDKVEKEFAVHAAVIKSSWPAAMSQCKAIP